MQRTRRAAADAPWMPLPAAERRDPDVRRRLSAPALRAFFNIAGAWQLSVTEQRALLGWPPSSTFHKYKSGDPGPLSFDALTRVSLDASNRPYLIWKVAFSRPKLGEMDTELFKEWFQAFAQSAGLTLHVENLYGENNHHIVESCYKGLARALRSAVELDPRKLGEVPSTKGTLGKSL